MSRHVIDSEPPRNYGMNVRISHSFGFLREFSPGHVTYDVIICLSVIAEL